jgi:glycosyltransferase involved in cell wall biosynthesis
VSNRRRLAVCYIVPGHNLVSSAGPTRNVLSLAESLGRWADVTVAFRKVLEPAGPASYRAVEIDPGPAENGANVDDASMRGISLSEFASYLRKIRSFVSREIGAFDIVLEKSWLLSGYVCAHARKKGVPGLLVENFIPMLREPLGGPADLLRHARLRMARMLAGRYTRKASTIIVETEELKNGLAERWGIPSSAIEVIGLGVDRAFFRPRDRGAARESFGISPDATVLLYTGVLDRTHNLLPVLEAMQGGSNRPVELHIVGDGFLRDLYERKAARCGDRVVFHGRVPHQKIPDFIAAADLCLAPYESSMFPGGKVAYSTLKIPEYLTGARPVVSVPSGNILRLVRVGETGFLFENTATAWVAFLRDLPSRDLLDEMGRKAAATSAVWGWDETARAYLSLCEREAARVAQS